MSQSAQSQSRFSLSSIVTLALWRLQKTWFLLFMNTLGMMAAVIIICSIPLFSDVMITSGLRSTLNATPESAEIQMSTNALGLSTPIVQTLNNQLGGMVHHYLGTVVHQTQFHIATSDFSFVKALKPYSSLTVYGISTQEAATHLGHLQGRNLQVTHHPGNDIEVLLTSETARQMGLTIGSTFKVQLQYLRHVQTPADNSSPVPSHDLLTAHVAGIFTLPANGNAYWHGQNFQPTTYATEQHEFTFYSMLMSNDALVSLFDTIRFGTHTGAIYTPSLGYQFTWYYDIDTSHIFNRNLDTLINQVDTLQVSYQNLSSDSSRYPYLLNPTLYGPLFGTSDTPGNMEIFRSRVDVVHIPVTILTLQILALILFFISLITNLLVDSQAETISLLRSRGASSMQIIGSLLAQSLVSGVLAVAVGIPLAVVTVMTLAMRLLPASEQNALNVITNNPLQAGLQIAWYGIAITLVAIVTMSITSFSAAHVDILALRRENARTRKRPLWQRLNLDLVAGIIALAGYCISLYLTTIGNTLQGDARTLIAAPLSIIAPFFLILACTLLFLRLFPFLLHLGASLTAHGRGAISLLALIQIARAPRQAIRMTMLLALAIAFALFTLVFTATQSQHIQDVSTYLAGADFSGSIPSNNNNSRPLTPAQEIRQYQSVPGVRAASVGYTASGESGNGTLPIEIRAVDTTTFADAVIWSSQEEYQAARTLLAQLQIGRTQAITTRSLPVIVDTNVLNILQLHVGSTFVVKEDITAEHDLRCVIIGTVQHIPTVNDRVTTQSGSGNHLLSSGVILIDYASYASIYIQQSSHNKNLAAIAPSINQVWLHTGDDASSLASVRIALARSYPLDNLSDRRALLVSLTNDPLYIVVGGVLGIGTVTALLLALLGDLLVSWLSAHTRLTNFAVLRAIGTTPQQVTKMIAWEQGVVYISGLLLGFALGITFAFTVIPVLTFTDLKAGVSSNAFYSLQSSLPAQIVLPPVLFIALLVLVLIFVVALIMMVRLISQPLLYRALRLSED